MNNRRLLTGLLAVVLSGSGVCSYGQTVMSLGTGLDINIEQPLYNGGAITGAIEMAELKSIGSQFATDLQLTIECRLLSNFLSELFIV